MKCNIKVVRLFIPNPKKKKFFVFLLRTALVDLLWPLRLWRSSWARIRRELTASLAELTASCGKP